MKHPLLEYIVQIRKTKQKQTKNIQNEEATYVLNSPKQFRPSPSQPSLQVHCPRPSGELRRHFAFESQNTPSHEPSARRENDRSMTPVVTVKTIILSKQILHHRSSLQSMNFTALILLTSLYLYRGGHLDHCHAIEVWCELCESLGARNFRLEFFHQFWHFSTVPGFRASRATSHKRNRVQNTYHNKGWHFWTKWL